MDHVERALSVKLSTDHIMKPISKRIALNKLVELFEAREAYDGEFVKERSVEKVHSKINEMQEEIIRVKRNNLMGLALNHQVYKWIESQAPNGCSTEAWKTRIHWVGSQVTGEFTESRADAEKYLQTHRPVRRKHGKLLEDGTSGFLQKKLAEEGSKDAVTTDVDLGSLNKLFSEGPTKDSASFGSKHWASVYLASTPQQAAEMGLEFPGVN